MVTQCNKKVEGFILYGLYATDELDTVGDERGEYLDSFVVQSQPASDEQQPSNYGMTLLNIVPCYIQLYKGRKLCTAENGSDEHEDSYVVQSQPLTSTSDEERSSNYGMI